MQPALTAMMSDRQILSEKGFGFMAKFYTAVVTILTKDGRIDHEGNKAVYEKLIAAGSDGIVLMGSTGEFCSLTMDMAKELIDLALGTIKGRMDVIVGASRMLPKESVELGNYAMEKGADAIIMISPYYFKLSDASIENFYDLTVPNIKGPVYIYNFPGCTAHEVSPELILKLRRKYSNIKGCKDTVKDFAHTRKICETVLPEFPDFEIYSGFDEFFVHNVMSGGAGCIGGLTNVCPELMADWVKAVNAKDWDKSAKIQRKVNKLMDMFEICAPFLTAVKRALLIQGVISNEYGSEPNVIANDAEDAKIREILEAIKN